MCQHTGLSGASWKTPRAALPRPGQTRLPRASCHFHSTCPSRPLAVSAVSAPGLWFLPSVLCCLLWFFPPHLSSQSGQMLKVRRNPQPTPTAPQSAVSPAPPLFFPPLLFTLHFAVSKLAQVSTILKNRWTGEDVSPHPKPSSGFCLPPGCNVSGTIGAETTENAEM